MTSIKDILSYNKRKQCPDCKVDMYPTGTYFDLRKSMFIVRCPQCSLEQVESRANEIDDNIEI